LKTARANGTRKSPKAPTVRKPKSRVEISTAGLKPVSRRALPTDTVALAKFLIGCIVVREIGNTVITGRIVETEAYLPDDEASHAFRGPTPRNGALFLARGHAYVYFIYGRSFMLNVSSETAGIGAGVLIRALEPLSGISRMARYRGLDAAHLKDLTSGPGRLAQALRINRSLDGVDLCLRGPLWLARDGYHPAAVTIGPRIGIRRNVAPLLRFHLAENVHVSRGRFLPEAPSRLR
jgi:DNA-3-methyladenine glycosylase